MAYEYNSKIAQEVDVILYEKTKAILAVLDGKIDYMLSMSDMNTNLAKNANGYMKEVYTEAANYYGGYADGLERAKEIVTANLVY